MSDQPIAVVGLGFLGRGIVASLLSHGLRVIGHSRSTEDLRTAQESIAQAIDEIVREGAAAESFRDTWQSRYTATTSFNDLEPSSFVIESVVEDLAVKNEVFDALEQVVAPSVPIASNTSAIPISVLQQACKHPERLLGMHWAEPAYATRFLELIRGEQTSDLAFEQAVELAHRCGKEPCFVKRDTPGFIANRLGYAMYREALHLLEAGIADAETIDRSFRNSIGLWSTFCGPFRWIDLTGGPKLYAKAMTPVLPTLDVDVELPTTMAELAGQEAQGTTNGRGFFEYTAEEATSWNEQFHHHAWAIKRLVDQARPLDQGSSEHGP